MMQPAVGSRDFQDPRPIGELFSTLARDTGTLVKTELELASIEMAQKANEIGRHSLVLVVGGAFAFAGFLVLLGAAVLALAFVVPLWSAALLVGAIAALAGAVILAVGRRAWKNMDLAPRETLRTLKENGQWAHEQMMR